MFNQRNGVSVREDPWQVCPHLTAPHLTVLFFFPRNISLQRKAKMKAMCDGFQRN
jgi:hypothetical protein